MPTLSIIPENSVIDDGNSDFWVAIEVSAQLSRPGVSDKYLGYSDCEDANPKLRDFREDEPGSKKKLLLKNAN